MDSHKFVKLHSVEVRTLKRLEVKCAIEDQFGLFSEHPKAFSKCKDLCLIPPRSVKTGEIYRAPRLG